MMKNLIKVIAVIGLTLSFQAQAKEKTVTYVGDGRYTCQGNGCDSFNREQKQINQERDSRERYYREEREQNNAIINELKETNRYLEEE
jgi:hypothetical protein